MRARSTLLAGIALVLLSAPPAGAWVDKVGIFCLVPEAGRPLAEATVLELETFILGGGIDEVAGTLVRVDSGRTASGFTRNVYDLRDGAKRAVTIDFRGNPLAPAALRLGKPDRHYKAVEFSREETEANYGPETPGAACYRGTLN